MDSAHILKHHGLRVTKIRSALLDQISHSSGAVPLGQLQSVLGSYDRTTLYRTLIALIDHGVIHKAIEDSTDTYYALCDGCSTTSHHHDHVHFQCSSCGTVRCVDVPTELSVNVPGCQIEALEITAKGVCAECAVA